MDERRWSSGVRKGDEDNILSPNSTRSWLEVKLLEFRS